MDDLRLLQIRSVLEPQLLMNPEVTAVSNTEDRLRIYVEGTTDIFPRFIEGYRVEVVKTGKIKALHRLYETSYRLTTLYEASSMNVPYITVKPTLDESRTDVVRPVVGGVSCGHPKITAGTMGVTLNIGGAKYGLSNNHVLAAASTDIEKRAEIGDLIYQPGVYDGGVEENSVGKLAWYRPISEKSPNLVDAALFKATTPELLSEEIMDIGTPQGYATVQVERDVKKSGRTTGLTQARVLDVNATVKVSYGVFGATFENQIITDYMADGGDSGSALLDMDNKLVGLLFAGSDYVTVHNHIGNVLREIGGTTVTPAGASPLGIVLPPIIGAVLLGMLK